jgi:hypothetical protein
MTGQPRWAQQAHEDVIGQDRLARSLLRVIARMPAGSIVAVHGAPGSGRDEFVRRLAWLAGPGRGRAGDVPAGIHPEVLWLDAWSWCKQGHVVSGLVGAVAEGIRQPGPTRERARELAAALSRMRFDGTMPEVPGPAFGSRATDPVADIGRAFSNLVDKVRDPRGGRLVMIIDGAERLTPSGRWQLIDGMRAALALEPELVMVLSIGRESVVEALRSHHGDMADNSAVRVLDDLFDLTVTVPNLEVRRIGTLLREYIGSAENTVRRSFGREALTGLSAAVAHRPLGSPRFLRRLAWRTVLLAEFAAEIRATRVLSEAQWAWVIISERWPDFRRFMIRGGRKRWVELARTVQKMKSGKPDLVAMTGGEQPRAMRSGISEWLDEDLILNDYLRLHAEGFAHDGEGIFWLENLMLAAGL